MNIDQEHRLDTTCKFGPDCCRTCFRCDDVIGGNDVIKYDDSIHCDFEMFQARCAARHEVVVMVAASYGRQETGRCLPPDSVIESLRHDSQYFGCSANVLRIADRKCSGLPRCDIAIPDSDFERITPCYKDSRKYLEAKYECVKGK